MLRRRELLENGAESPASGARFVSPLWVLEDSLFIFHEPTLSMAMPKFTTDHYTPLQARIPK
jgi:hypothetical protein